LHLARDDPLPRARDERRVEPGDRDVGDLDRVVFRTVDAAEAVEARSADASRGVLLIGPSEANVERDVLAVIADRSQDLERYAFVDDADDRLEGPLTVRVGNLQIRDDRLLLDDDGGTSLAVPSRHSRRGDERRARRRRKVLHLLLR